MLPPSVKIVDHQLHHEILGPVFLIVPLQDVAAGACLKDGDVAVKDLVETKGFVEALGQIEILGRKKGADQFCPVGSALIQFLLLMTSWSPNRTVASIRTALHDARSREPERFRREGVGCIVLLGGLGYATSLAAASRRFTTHQNVVTALAFPSKKSSKNPGLLRGGGYA